MFKVLKAMHVAQKLLQHPGTNVVPQHSDDSFARDPNLVSLNVLEVRGVAHRVILLGENPRIFVSSVALTAKAWTRRSICFLVQCLPCCFNILGSPGCRVKRSLLDCLRIVTSPLLYCKVELPQSTLSRIIFRETVELERICSIRFATSSVDRLASFFRILARFWERASKAIAWFNTVPIINVVDLFF